MSTRVVQAEQLAGAEHEGVGVGLVAVEGDGDLGAGRDLVGVGRRLADLGPAQHVGQLADPGLLLALLLPGRVVAAVLPEVALVARLRRSWP